MATALDPDKVAEIKDVEMNRLQARTRQSFQLVRRSVNRMPLGVPSSIFAIPPYPLTILSGLGARIIDADGNEYLDYGGGYGTSVFGHANPEITAAIISRAERGVFFGALGRDVTDWAELMADRFQLDWVRFASSGSEAVQEALRLAKALTDRDRIVKIEGSYNGTSPWTLHSTHPELELAGPADRPNTVPVGKGLDSVDNVDIIPFNDLVAAERLLIGGSAAALITEPILFNVGAIFPAEGYLQGLRELCDRTGTLLIFDEVKTGVAIAYGGAQEYFGVEPDLKAFGKGIGGGLAAGAFGGRAEDGYTAISDWTAPHFGTFSGNHLVAAAGTAALKLLDRPAYQQLEDHRLRLAAGLEQAIAEFDLPAYVDGAAAKNSVVWADPEQGRLHDFRDYIARLDEEVGTAMWFWMMNRGVWLTPGRDEQTTHSIAHTDADADAYIAAFHSFCAELRKPVDDLLFDENWI